VIKNLDYGVLHDRLQELIELGATEHDCRALLLNQRILVHFARYIPRRIVNVWEENQGFSAVLIYALLSRFMTVRDTRGSVTFMN
jgi:hypothetical protein